MHGILENGRENTKFCFKGYCGLAGSQNDVNYEIFCFLLPSYSLLSLSAVHQNLSPLFLRQPPQLTVSTSASRHFWLTQDTGNDWEIPALPYIVENAIYAPVKNYKRLICSISSPGLSCVELSNLADGPLPASNGYLSNDVPQTSQPLTTRCV